MGKEIKVFTTWRPQFGPIKQDRKSAENVKEADTIKDYSWILRVGNSYERLRVTSN